MKKSRAAATPFDEDDFINMGDGAAPAHIPRCPTVKPRATSRRPLSPRRQMRRALAREEIAGLFARLGHDR
jgi:hypothetical protein